ncbi:MAG: hypothetical protein JOZ44_04330 [Acidobacteria bacterium]|nr:hypothetical protein [Acidobacteriota bacterium]
MTLAGFFIYLLAIYAGGWQQPSAAVSPAPDRNAFTFLNWRLDLRIDANLEALSARGTILLRNDSSQPQRQATLQISSSLKWAAIRQNGAAAPFTASQLRSDLDHSGGVNEAVLDLARPVPPGSTVELEVGYSGTISLDTTRLAHLGVPLDVRAATDYDRITPTFTCLRGVGHVLWFPVSLDPASLADGNRVFEETSAWAVRHSSSSMTVRFSDSQQPAFQTNAQMSRIEFSGSVRTEEHEWQHLGIAGPILIAGDYKSLSAHPQQAKDVGLHFRADHELQAQDYARVIQETVPTISGKAEFPTSVLELPEDSDSIFDADTALLTPFKTTDRKSLELAIAFLLAHQTLWSPRAWIYEGAAHLAQALERERQDGRAAAIAYMEQRLAPLTLVDSGDAQHLKSSSLVNSASEVYFRTKAMYVWWMLREIVGQRAILDSLAQYDPGADKEPSYMQRLLEKNSHKDLEWFFDDWVYQDRGLSEFTVSNGYARPSLQGIFLVSATIENKGGAAAEVPVIVRTESGSVVTRLRVPAHDKAAARIEVSSRPLEITVNDGSVPELDRTDNTTSVRIANQ